MLDCMANLVAKAWGIVYVDRLRVTVGPARKDYVGRINRSIEEAMSRWELPRPYAAETLRQFTPEQMESEGHGDDVKPPAGPSLLELASLLDLGSTHSMKA